MPSITVMQLQVGSGNVEPTLSWCTAGFIWLMPAGDGVLKTGGKRASCDDGETRNIVASRMQPANNGSLHVTLQNGSMTDYWQLDLDKMNAKRSDTKTKSRDPGTSVSVPRMLVQWGLPRTGTTFQFTALCASAVLLSSRDDEEVDCMYTKKEKE